MSNNKPGLVAEWLSSFPWSIRKATEGMDADSKSPTELATLINAHVVEAHRSRKQNEFTDVETCEQCAVVALVLAGELERLTGDQALLARLAINYFVENNDGECDFTSPAGFDDDLKFLESAVVRLGLSDNERGS